MPVLVQIEERITESARGAVQLEVVFFFFYIKNRESGNLEKTHSITGCLRNAECGD